MSSYSLDFDNRWQVVTLQVESFLILFLYFLMFIAILDTMRLHDIFSIKGFRNKSLNLYLFYIMSIFVILGRFMSLICLFIALQINDWDVLAYYNYGFYTGTFAIILIAVSEVNSIATTTLRLRYLNKQLKGGTTVEQDQSKLNY